MYSINNNKIEINNNNKVSNSILINKQNIIKNNIKDYEKDNDEIKNLYKEGENYNIYNNINNHRFYNNYSLDYNNQDNYNKKYFYNQINNPNIMENIQMKIMIYFILKVKVKALIIWN